MRRGHLGYRRMSPKVALTRFALGQIDPFDERVLGAKIPDANTTPSSTAVANDEWNLTSDVLQTCNAAAYRPFLANNYVQANPTTGAAWTWPASFSGFGSTRQTAIQNNNNLIRVCAHGVRIACPVAPTLVTGFVHIGLYAGSNLGKSTWDLPTSFAQMNQCVWYKRLPLATLTQRPMTIVNKFLDASSTIYHDPNSDGAATGTDVTFQQTGFCDIIVALEGIPIGTATQLGVETIIHVEGLPKATGILTPSPAAEFNPAEMARVSRIASVTDATMMQGDEDRHYAAAYDAVVAGVQDAAGQVAGAIGEGLRGVAYGVGQGAVHAAANLAAGMLAPGLPGVTNARLTIN